MEAADGAASDAYKHHGEDGGGVVLGAETIPDLGQLGRLDVEHDEHAECHEQERDGKYGIDAADNLVDGEQRGKDIVDEYRNDTAIQFVFEFNQ